MRKDSPIVVQVHILREFMLTLPSADELLPMEINPYFSRDFFFFFHLEYLNKEIFYFNMCMHFSYAFITVANS